MSERDKEYDAFQIFEQIQGQDKESEPPAQKKSVSPVSVNDAPYYEIEYDACPLPGVGKFVLKSDKIEAPQKDEVRDLFYQMRDIARENRYLHFGSSKFYDKRTQQESSRVFYRQGMFMKDFEDDYAKSVPFSSYFPNYQMMGYDQLRTYFTWRTQIRQGKVEHISLSYAFLYIYELLNNIGVDSPEEGLDMLMSFWDAFRVYDQSVDKYVLKWLKDYHIYYPLPQPFKVFIVENQLEAYYPGLSDPEDCFDLYCAISKYDIRKSAFYTEEKSGLIQDCFYFMLDRLEQVFDKSRINLEDYIFQPTKSMSSWTPFQGALFYPALRQEDRKVVLSEKEIYVCSQNRWTFSTMITTESGKQLIGYSLKQMESILRELTKYKYKLTANPKSLSPVMADEFRRAGISLETVVTEAVREFYREATRTVVKVDPRALEKIRRESLATQERLIVPEETEQVPFMSLQSEICGPATLPAASAGGGQNPGTSQSSESSNPAASSLNELQISALSRSSEFSGGNQAGAEVAEVSDLSGIFADEQEQVSNEKQEMHSVEDEWQELRGALTEMERKALSIIIDGSTSLKQFADGHGIMLEVLADGINEKAMDFIGDSLLDEEFTIYDDYIEQVKGMVEAV